MLKRALSAMDAAPKRVPIPRRGVDYRGKVVLAPMVRSGELPSRLLALQYGADLVWGPETIDKAMIGCECKPDPITNTVVFTRTPSNPQSIDYTKKESVIYRLHPELEKGKLIYQVGSANPDLAVRAAKMVAPYVAGIDLNSGCPKPFSTSGGMGAALLRTPDLLCSILEALVEEVGKVYEIGISVKIRLLETPELTRALVERLVRTGITGLTIHCRTTPMRPRERALRDQLRMIGDICREAGVACLMNGDVANRDEALQLAREYGVDGGMIATAAEANPSVFRSKADGGKADWKEVAYEYMKLSLSVDNKWANTRFTMSQLMPGKLDVAKTIAQSGKSNVQIVELLEFSDLLERAREVDERLGLNEYLKRSQKTKKMNKSAKGAGRSALSSPDAKRKPLSQRGVGTAIPMAPQESSPLETSMAPA